MTTLKACCETVVLVGVLAFAIPGNAQLDLSPKSRELSSHRIGMATGFRMDLRTFRTLSLLG